MAWGSQSFTHKPGVVACDDVCWSKTSGGLGFRDVIAWNIACIGKYVCAIERKKDNVWIWWVHVAYIKENNCWDYTPNSGVSWYLELYLQSQRVVEGVLHRKGV